MNCKPQCAAPTLREATEAKPVLRPYMYALEDVFHTMDGDDSGTVSVQEQSHGNHEVQVPKHGIVPKGSKILAC